MTFETEDQQAEPDWTIECARVVYASVGRALKKRILWLDGAPPNDKEAKVIADELRTHQKALLQLTEHEAKRHAQRLADGTADPIGLDLDAARDELRARISKLRQRGGD